MYLIDHDYTGMFSGEGEVTEDSGAGSEEVRQDHCQDEGEDGTGNGTNYS